MNLSRPNILLVMADSLPPMLAGTYGSRVGATPNIDALAACGITFDCAYCSCPLCAPSRASLVTGRYVSEIGAFDNASSFAPEWPTVGHALASAGYEAVICGKMHFVGHDQLHGFRRRIALETDYCPRYDPREFRIAFQWAWPSIPNPDGDGWMGRSYVRDPEWEHYPRHYDRDETIHREACAFLRERSSGTDPRPFFLCVSYHAPHNPFWILPEIRARFADADLPLPCVPPRASLVHGPMDDWLDTFHYVPQVRDRMLEPQNLRWLYETLHGMIWDLDRRVGDLLAILDAQGLGESTAVVLTSDHGDMLAHRGMLQKRYFYDWSTRVPLLFRWPGVWRAGERERGVASLVDLFPTLASVAGASVPSDLPGCDLSPVLRGDAPMPKRAVFAEYHGEGVHAPCFMARAERWKYLYVHGHEQRLYDLQADPEELENLAGRRGFAPRMAALRESVLRRFDPDSIARAAIRSQRNRRFVYESYLRERGEAEGRSSTTTLPLRLDS